MEGVCATGSIYLWRLLRLPELAKRRPSMVEVAFNELADEAAEDDPEEDAADAVRAGIIKEMKHVLQWFQNQFPLTDRPPTV